MDKATIQKIIEQQEKISERNYRNFQESGISRYMRAHEKAEDLIDICRMALGVADIKEQNVILKANFTEVASMAIRLDHDNRWLDQANLDEIGHLVKDLAAMGRVMGVNDPWR